VRLSISIDEQVLRVIRGDQCIREYTVSTALNGEGFAVGSYRTPTGTFRICERIGDGEPSGKIFKARVAVGIWDPSDASDDDLILTRILRLEGLEPINANTFERCIYIHGTNREDQIGQPASHGCIRLRNADIIELFDMISVGDDVEILPSHHGLSGWKRSDML